MAFAIIRTGGKQYRVEPGQKLKVEKIIPAEDGSVVFTDVLMTVDGEKTTIGTPTIAGVTVTAQLVEQGRGDKVIVFKYSSKTRYKKKKGHRQEFTEVEIMKIS